ncbi:MAG: hypothetical protein JNK65_09170 [Deltaproteobacteria bacterium]|nr:hypothetical protein [Deltaproteobacteria bacterium]
MILELQTDGTVPKNKKDNIDLIEFEMTLQNASLAHEYTRLELDSATSRADQYQLTEKLESYKNDYFKARRYLEQHYPEHLERIEEKLLCQKMENFTYYTA